jgi:hypothetical protein
MTGPPQGNASCGGRIFSFRSEEGKGELPNQPKRSRRRAAPSATLRVRPAAAAHLPSLSVVDGALNYWAKCATEPEPVSPPVEEVTGVLAHALRQRAVDHAGDFR